MNINKHIIAVVLAAGILSAGCSSDKQNTAASEQENYRDDLFVKMLNDTIFMHQERLLQEADSVAFYAHFEQPLLWEDGGDTTLRQMADFYNICANANAVTTDVHTWYRYDESEKMRVEMLNSWRQMAFSCISDTWARNRLKEARDVDTEARDDMETKDISDVYERLSAWAPDFDSVFYTDTIVPQISPQSFLPDTLSRHYDEYIGHEASPSDTMISDLYTLYRQEKNFDTRMAMLFMLIGTNYYASNDTVDLLIKDAEAAFTSGNYSPMMPLLWRAYRVVYCNTYGCPSTYCERPNVRFNYYRRLVAYTFLRHIQRHPDDRVALVQFYMLAEKENIDRFGEYPYGHQGAAEHIYIFWNGSLL